MERVFGKIVFKFNVGIKNHTYSYLDFRKGQFFFFKCWQWRKTGLTFPEWFIFRTTEHLLDSTGSSKYGAY